MINLSRKWSAAFVALMACAATVPALAQDRAELLGKLPANLQALYTDVIEVAPGAYDSFTPKAKPWVWCHSESYMGNPWRVTMNEELKRLVQVAIEAGDVSEYVTSDSNGDTTQQIAQIRSFIDRGCSIISTIAGSSTALNDAIDAAHAAGIPVVTIVGAVTTPNAINVMQNQNLWGYDMGLAIAAALPNGGNVLQVEGIPGHPLVLQENAGLDLALSQHSNIVVVRKVSGEWTASVTKAAVLQALATTPQQIDAVWTTGSETRVIAEAFEQAGRPVPLITGSVSGDALGYWNEHKDTFKFSGGIISPQVSAWNAYRVGMRLLAGQKPVVNTLIAPTPSITPADMPSWYQPCMTPDSSSTFPIPASNDFPDELMDGYFTGGTGSPDFDYATIPSTCP